MVIVNAAHGNILMDEDYFEWHFFFFNDTATTEIYTLSLHDALPISPPVPGKTGGRPASAAVSSITRCAVSTDSTRHRAPLKMSDAPGRIGRSTGSEPSV